MILITGGAGYVGAHAAKALSTNGYTPLVLDNLVYGHREFVRWGELLVGDLADAALLKELFKTYPIKAVMHFAGFAYVGESVVDPAKYYRNNVVNTLNLLEAMRGAEVDKVIISSTCATYGVPLSIPITEDHPQLPINPYGRTKLMVEHMLQDFCAAYGMRHVVLRYFNAAGADPDGEIGEWHVPETHLIPLAIDAACGKSPLRVFGVDYNTPDGTCIRDYIHVSDLATAHVLALEYLMVGGKSIALNLGNSHGFSVREVIKTIEQVTGLTVPVEEAHRRHGDPPILVGSSVRARQLLGWQPHYSTLESIISTAWKWYAVLDSHRGPE